MNEIAEKFAINFNQNVINIVHPCNVTTLETRTQRIISNSMYLEYTKESEINNILKTLNSRKSAGIDNIRAIDLKNNADILTPIVTHFINSSLKESSIPQTLIKRINNKAVGNLPNPLDDDIEMDLIDLDK